MASSSEVFQRPNADARIFDLGQFTFWDEIKDRPGVRTNVTFGERNGAPRISFFPRSETGPKVIGIGMDPVTFYRFLGELTEVANGPKGVRKHIDNYMKKDEVERMPTTKEELVVRNRLFYGKDEEGICWIGASQGETNVRIRMLPSLWHEFHDASGKQIEKTEASRLQTVYMVSCLEKAFSNFISRLRAPTAPGEGVKKPTPAGGESLSTLGADEDFLI